MWIVQCTRMAPNKNCVNLFARSQIRLIIMFYQSTQLVIEIKQIHYFKDKISLTFSLTGQYFSKNLYIV